MNDNQLGITTINRDDKYQVEVNSSFNIVFSIVWVNECTYELRPFKVIKGDASIIRKDIIVTVEIVDIRKQRVSSYFYNQFI